MDNYQVTEQMIQRNKDLKEQREAAEEASRNYYYTKRKNGEEL